jgi:hypothetical protein
MRLLNIRIVRDHMCKARKQSEQHGVRRIRKDTEQHRQQLTAYVETMESDTPLQCNADLREKGKWPDRQAWNRLLQYTDGTAKFL